MRHSFVGREAELGQLTNYLKTMLTGKMQVSFVAGDPGTGKTILIERFSQFALSLDPKLRYLSVQCNDVTGINDPYLPFKQVLMLLVGMVADKSQSDQKRLSENMKTTGRALVEVAPELLGTLIPGAGVIAALVRMGMKERGLLNALEAQTERSKKFPTQVEQTEIFIQYTALLKSVTQDYPLVITIDDLQWVDASSAGLLFHLIRELKDSRILFIGTYRPAEINIGRNGQSHPVEKVLDETWGYFGKVVIDLNNTTRSTGRDFVDQLLDTFPNRLDEKFRDTLYKHTGGNALFTSELINFLEDEQALVEDEEGFLITSPSLNWSELPTRIEAVVESRVKLLDTELLDTLKFASVNGFDFAAQIIALAREIRERDILRQLSQELQRRHQLVYENDEYWVGSKVLTQYSFFHHIFHRYVYQTLLSKGEKRYMHRLIGEILEEFCQGHTEQIAVQLAHHFYEAGIMEKAVEYLVVSVRQHMRTSEFKDALAKIQQANALYETGNIRRDDLLLQINYMMGICYSFTGEKVNAKKYLEQALQTASATNDKEMKVNILLSLSSVSSALREKENRKSYLYQAYELAKQINNEELLARTLRVLAIYHKSIEGVQYALDYYHKSLELAVATGDLAEQVKTLNSLGVTYSGIGEVQKGLDYYEQSLNLAKQENFVNQTGMILSNLAYRKRALGLFDEAIVNYREALEIAVRIGSRGGQKIRLHGLAKTFQWMGEFDQAEDLFRQSLDIAKELDTPGSKVDPYRDMAILCVQRGHLQKAKEYLLEASSFVDSDDSTIAMIEIIKALVDIKEKNFESAHETLLKALDFIESTLLKRTSESTLFRFCQALALAVLAVIEKESATALALAQKAMVCYADVIQSVPFEKGTMKFYGFDLLNIIAQEDSEGLLVPIREFVKSKIMK